MNTFTEEDYQQLTDYINTLVLPVHTWVITVDPPIMTAGDTQVMAITRVEQQARDVAANVGGIVTRDNSSNRYIVFSDHSNLETYIRATEPARRSLEERIYDGKQKLRLDIDVNVTPEAIAEKRVLTLEDVNAIIEEAQWILAVMFTNAHDARIYVCDSSDMTEKALADGTAKQSLHIIIDKVCVNGFATARRFAAVVQSHLDERIKAAIDLNVYSRACGLRLAWCDKYKLTGGVFIPAGRNKRLPADVSFKSTLITDCAGCTELVCCERYVGGGNGNSNGMNANVGNINDMNVGTNAIIPAGLMQDIINSIPVEYLHGHKLRKINGNYINFERKSPTACHISGKIHDRDNTLFAQVCDQVLLLYCRHCCKGIPPTRINIPDRILEQIIYTLQPGPIKDVIKQKRLTPIERRKIAETRIEKMIAQPVHEHEIQYDGPTHVYTGVMNQHGDMMEDYPLEPRTLLIKAQMGAGKTQALCRYLDMRSSDIELLNLESISAETREIISRVLLSSAVTVCALTARRSITNDIVPKLGLKSYQEIDGHITADEHPRVAVQVESIARLAPHDSMQVYNVLLLDEVESIFAQLFSPTHKNARAAWIVFECIVKKCDYVICMDANLSQPTVDLMKSLRIQSGAPSLIINKAIPCKSHHYITTNKAALVDILMNMLHHGSKVVIPTASCKHAKKLYSIITKAFPEMKVKMYNSETPEKVKSEDFANVNESWQGLDALIYTPTVTAGLSFTRDWYTDEVCFWYDTSVDVYASLQMYRRVRKISSGNVYHYISESVTSLPDTPALLLAHLEKSYENLIAYHEQGVPDEGCVYDDANFRLVFPKSYRLDAWLMVTARKNMSKNKFMSTLISELKLLGGETEVIHAHDEASVETQQIVNKRLLSVGAEITLADATAVATAHDIDDTNANVVSDMNNNNKHAIEKLQFRRFYNYYGEISARMIIDYTKYKVRHWYLRRKRLRGFDGEEASLHIIGTQFLAAVRGWSDVDHLISLFSINRDRICIEYLKMFGMSFGFKGKITKEQLLGALTTNHEYLRRSYVYTCRLFGSALGKLPAIGDANYIMSMMKHINGKLECQYGIKIKATNKHRSEYKLEDIFASMFDDNFEIIVKK